MANFSDQTKLDKLWKLAFNRSRGTNDGEFFEESIASVVDVTATDVYSEAIPENPPSSDTDIVKVWRDPNGIPMTLDKKYTGNRVWLAKPTFDSNFSSGSGDVSDIMKNFISPKYGSGYVVVVKNKDGDVIPELDDSSWLFDYKSGVLSFEQSSATVNLLNHGGTSESDCIVIEAYQYVGDFLSHKADMVEGGTPGNVVVLDSEGNIADGGVTVSQLADKTYTFEQFTAQSTWTINHGLSKYPSVQVVDSAGTVVIGDIEYVDQNQVVLKFSAPFAGIAHFN